MHLENTCTVQTGVQSSTLIPITPSTDNLRYDIGTHNKLTCNLGNAFVRKNVMQGCFFTPFKERRRLYILSVNA
jgi:hypothetical protein